MTPESFFKNKRITVFGLGLNMGGVGTVQYLATHGAREIIVTDMKSREELKPSLEKLALYKNITYVLGQHRREDFTEVDMVIKNPIIPWTNEYVQLAKEHGVPVEMDSSIFFLLCKAPIIGVTGSKGKTTTASLIAHILESAEKKVLRVGVSQVGVLGVLDHITEEHVVVFELSSWRLSALTHLKRSPHIAVVTNIFPDHLNYYKTMSAYADDKKNIFRFQKPKDIVITDFDNILARELVQDATGSLLFTSVHQPIDGDGAWLADETLFVSEQGKESVLLPVSLVPLRGTHNISNVLLATLAVLSFGVALKDVRAGIKSFSGIPHRLEKIAEKNGVTYYNDTAATIPDAAIMALRSFSEPVILIAGGSDKRLDFTLFAEEILARPKGLILLRGEGTEKIIQAIRQLLPDTEKERPFEVVESMSKAVELASQSAEPGDVVLLSPGAASFGLFKNEFDRGEQFRKAVDAL
ncbi:MAG: UDP-N-acetylmuramoyl-L-alanine--D-glutamate ligase [Candidatus Moranbacteria bacterium]|nr:UDP-N-acetylmuramoyl-L-alanine--D-glutamate ligase [Candidatus Moranbacteria bacterium]